MKRLLAAIKLLALVAPAVKNAMMIVEAFVRLIRCFFDLW